MERLIRYRVLIIPRLTDREALGWGGADQTHVSVFNQFIKPTILKCVFLVALRVIINLCFLEINDYGAILSLTLSVAYCQRPTLFS